MSDYDEGDNVEMMMPGQTPQSPDFKASEDNFLNFDPKPKCLFGVPVEDQMQVEINEEDQQKQQLLSIISDYQQKKAAADDQAIEDQLFPTRPMCLMDTPEFSQEKKKKTQLIKFTQAPPFSHREFFENASLQDQKYLGSIQ